MKIETLISLLSLAVAIRGLQLEESKYQNAKLTRSYKGGHYE